MDVIRNIGDFWPHDLWGSLFLDCQKEDQLFCEVFNYKADTWYDDNLNICAKIELIKNTILSGLIALPLIKINDDRLKGMHVRFEVSTSLTILN